MLNPDSIILFHQLFEAFMIYLERIHHREQDRILLKPAERMEKSDFNAYAEKIKQVAGVAYSKTHQGYHVPYTRSSFTRLGNFR